MATVAGAAGIERGAALRALAFHAAAVAATALAVFAVGRLPGMPYNVPKLVPAGATGVLSALGLAAVLWWIGVGLFPILDPRRRAPLVFFPAVLLVHGIVAWVLLYAAVPLPMIYKITGSVLGWPGAWETLARYAALHLALATQLLGAMLVVRWRVTGRGLRDVVYWALVSALMCGPLYYAVVERAATDNLVELMRDQASFGAASALAGGVFLSCLCGAALGAVLAGARGRLGLLLLAVAAAVGATGLYALGQEPYVIKYGKAFSGAQFALSASREQYAHGADLAGRYALAFGGAVLALAAMQARAWRHIARQSFGRADGP